MAIEIRTNTPNQAQASKAKSRKELSEVKRQNEEHRTAWENRKEYDDYFDKIVERHEKTLAYNAAYQRDLRTIKRLGLSVTVKQYRESLK